MNTLLVYFFIIVDSPLLVAIRWPLQSNTGCYGSTAGDFLRPKCNAGSVIAVKGVFTMTKKYTTTGCPQIAVPENRDEEHCCRVSPEDCKMRYIGSDLSYYKDCTGLPTCIKKVTWSLTQCNDTDYLSKSNYMSMEYYCIDSSLIMDASVTEDRTANHTAVYVHNPSYPAQSALGGSCSVTSSCSTILVVTIIHLNLKDDGAGGCLQHINITDGNTSTILDCSRNNADDFNIMEVYTSSSHSLLLDFVSNTVGDEGQMWIEVKGSNPNAYVEIRCGASIASSQSAVADCPVYIPNVTTTPDEVVGTSTSTLIPADSSSNTVSTDEVVGTSTSTLIPADSSSNTVSTDSPKAGETKSGIDSGVLAGIITVAILLVLLVVAAIVITKLYTRNRTSPDTGMTLINGSITGPEDGGLPVSIFGKRRPILTQTAPNKTSFLQRNITAGNTDQVLPETAVKHVPSELKMFGAVPSTSSRSNAALPGIRGATDQSNSPPDGTTTAPEGDFQNDTSEEHVFPPMYNNLMEGLVEPDGDNGKKRSKKSKKKKKKKKRRIDTEEIIDNNVENQMSEN